jgi:TRAP-type transport system periplasmic protein
MKPFCAWALFLLLLVSAATGGAAERFTAVTFSQRDSVWTRNFHLFTDRVTEQSKGAVTFRYAGGPEAIPPFEQIEAVRRGVVQIALLPAAYFVPQLPEVDAIKLSPYAPWEERHNGVYRYYNDLMRERLGVFYLGRLTAGIKYHFYLKQPIGQADFSGLKIRVTPIYEPFVRALKGTPVTMAPSEVYVALQRGVVDGLGWPSIGFVDLGWQEVVKYIVEPGFYQSDVCVLVNLKTWKGLSAETKELLVGTMEKAEKESYQLSSDMALEERRVLLEKGLKVLHLKDYETAEYLRLASKAAWDKVLAKCPVSGPTIRRLMEPKIGKGF